MKKIYFLLFFFGSLSLSYAQTWQNLYQKADSLRQKRDFKNAIPFYEQALPLAEAAYGKQHENTLNTRNGWGLALILGGGEKAKTETLLLENLQMGKQFGEKTAMYAQALHNLGTYYLPQYQGKNPTQSETYLKQAILLRKEIIGTKHQDYATSINNLALLYRATGKYTEAEKCYQESMQIRKETVGTKHPDYLASLNNLANFYYANMNNYLLAMPLYQEALKVRKETLGTKHLDYANSLNNLAFLYTNMGYYEKAEPLYREALQIRKEGLGTKHADYTQSLNNLGLLYAQTGDYDRAEKLYQEAIKIRKETLGEKNANYANSLNNLALLYYDQQDYVSAENLYQDVLRIRKEVLGEKHPDYANTLNNLAIVYKSMGRQEEEEAHYLQALRIYQQAVGTQHPDYVRVLGNWAELKRDQDSYALADSMMRERLKVVQATLNISLFWAYNGLGTIQTAQARYPEAEEHLRKASELLEKLQGRESLIATQQAQDFGTHYWQQGQGKKARPFFEQVHRNVIKNTQELFPHMDGKAKESFFEGIQKHIKYFDAFALEHDLLGEMYDLQLFAKGILLSSAQKMKNRILNSGDSSLIRRYEAWASLKLSLTKYKQMSQAEQRQGNIKLDSLESAADALEKELSLQSESFASLSERKRSTWQDIKRKLRKGEAAVEIIRINKFGVQRIARDTTDFRKNPAGFQNPQGFPKYPRYGLTDTIYYAALIVRHNSKKPELVLLTKGKEMEGIWFKVHRNAARYQVTDNSSYQYYWQPIKEKLKGIRKIYFSPEGIYNQINLNILQNPETQQYIIDEIEIQQVINTKEILAYHGQKDAQTFDNLAKSKACLFGRPAYDMDSLAFLASIELGKETNQNYALRDLRDLRSGKFSDLIGTEKEVRVIDSLLQTRKLPTERYLLGEATEQRIKNLRNPSILHIATHGFFIPDSTSQNPMMNSGILLAGVSNYYRSAEKLDTEDGVLTAQEAQNLHLDETDLVVLSACETGLGEVKNGEGVYGLQRAFRVAGATTLLMSYWKVDDKVTQELMIKFYENWLKIGNKRKAFIETQRQLRQKYPSPYYWGAFMILGE